MYTLIRFLLFLLPAELSHNLGLKGLKLAHMLGLSGLLSVKVSAQPCTVFGVEFANPVGLAAGLDKNGDYIDVLGELGFGFIEIGTVTPLPQSGNPKPRLFRLPQHQAIINRMGFNNKGVDYMVERLKARRYQGVIGVNIGKNFITSVEDAVQDYLTCLRKVYVHADYIVINLSSPNTPGLRSLQFGEHLDHLLIALKREQSQLHAETGRAVPLLVKIAPDLDENEINQIARSFIQNNIEGIIATNTTINREGIKGDKFAEEQGGLSGAPLSEQSTLVLKSLCNALQGKIPVIGVGGIMSPATAHEKFAAGASLVQIYSGFIYQGPELIGKILVSGNTGQRT